MIIDVAKVAGDEITQNPCRPITPFASFDAILAHHTLLHIDHRQRIDLPVVADVDLPTPPLCFVKTS
ncbi:MAG: hypothetical protein RLP44_21560 [Aggregatilineales bacterium]